MLPRTRSARRYNVPAGDSRLVRFRLTKRELRKARRERPVRLTATLTNEDAAEGVTIARGVELKRPAKPKKTAKKKKRKRR